MRRDAEDPGRGAWFDVAWRPRHDVEASPHARASFARAARRTDCVRYTRAL
jgi:hypothetical protein